MLDRTLAWWGLLFACIVAVAASLVVLAFALGAALDPTSSYYATMSSPLWTTFWPHFVAVAIVASLTSLAGCLWGPLWLGRVATLTSAGAALVSVFIVGSIMAAAFAAGGTVNPVAGLIIGKMAEPHPDEIAAFAAGENNSLTAAIYLPPAPPTSAPVLVYIHGGGFMIGTNQIASNSIGNQARLSITEHYLREKNLTA